METDDKPQTETQNHDHPTPQTELPIEPTLNTGPRTLIFDDHDDPHTAAFVEGEGHLTPTVWAAVFFLGLTFEAAIGFSFSCVVAIIVPIALDLQGSVLNISWIPSGWAVASSVSFAIAGQFSDIFGRRYVILFGQLLVVLGMVVLPKLKLLTS